MLAIICATEIEYFNVKQYYETKKVLFNVDKEYSLCRLHSGDCIVMLSDIGFENARKSIEFLLGKYDVQLVLSVGMAGGLNESVAIGDIIISNYIHLVSDEEKSYCINESITNFLYQMAVNAIGNQKKRGFIPKVYKGSVISVNEFITSGRNTNCFDNTYNGWCVEMESGVIAEACRMANVSFAAIKVISDFADELALESIYKNQIKATSILGKVLFDIIYNLRYVDYKAIAGLVNR